jgi:Animal haem peroxidase
VGARRLNRRRFLGTVGAGALAAGTGLTAARLRGGDDPTAAGFGRMFSLPPFAEPTPKLNEALMEMGSYGGLLDAGDDLSVGAETLFLEKYIFTDESGYRFAGNRLNPSNTQSVAGTTFLAQFMAHDITFDAVSPLGRPAEVSKTPNARTPAFDLESLYGGGAALAPQLYDADEHAKFRVDRSGRYEDVPRAENGTPLVGDPRNDQTAILAGFHAAFLLFHNRLVDRVGAGLDARAAFERARRETRWHYQWLILDEFLPHVVGRELVDDVLKNGRRVYRPSGKPFLPVEFSAGAFRFGHSMIRPSYRLNFEGDGGKPFFAMTFDPAENGKADPNDLRGGFRSPRRYVDWQSFFDFGDGMAGPSKRIDTRISTPLFQLPLGAIPTREPPQSLIQRDLLRHVTWGLPSGQAIARELGAPVIDPFDLRELKPFGHGLDRSTPLWYYVLKEAELVQGGTKLGPVGGRIVAETVIGLLELDRSSFLHAKPRWKPTVAGAKFGTVDLLTFAGVDPSARAV